MGSSLENAAPDYMEVPLGEFLDLVASREPAPGGGASAAVTVALAAALSSMAARFATDHLTEAPVLAERAEKLRGEVAPLAQADAAAYGRVLEAYRLPPEHRQRRIREALSEAADVPLSIAGVGAEVAELAAHLALKGNPNLKGDALAAAELATAGVRAAATLVELNISAGGADDGRLARANELVAEATAAWRSSEAAGAHGM
jgi:formiminotetrahydrofolate cyclodeaminase